VKQRPAERRIFRGGMEMAKSNCEGIDVLISETPVPDFMKKLRRIGREDLVAGGHYLRFDGSQVRRIEAIEGDRIHFQPKIRS
jgi:hypothetical protein